MRTPHHRSRFVLALTIFLISGCAGWSYPSSGTYYDYDWVAAWGGTWEDYFWDRTPFEGFTIVHPPAYVGERWDDLVLRAEASRDRRGGLNDPPAGITRARRSTCRAEAPDSAPGTSTAHRHARIRGGTEVDPPIGLQGPRIAPRRACADAVRHNLH